LGVLDDDHRETVAVGLGVGHGGPAYCDPIKATQPIKNLVLVSAAMVVGATSRGGLVIHDRRAAEAALHTQTLYARFRRQFNREP